MANEKKDRNEKKIQINFCTTKNALIQWKK